MRSQDQSRTVDEAPIDHRFRLGVNVQRGREDPAGAQRVDQRGFVDAATARTVLTRIAVGFIAASRAALTIPRRRRGQRAMQADDVGGRKQLVDRHGAGRGRIRPDRAHPERLGAPHHGATDPAQPDDAERLAVELDSEQLVEPPARPRAAADQPLALG